jgi:hypothetical protein
MDAVGLAAGKLTKHFSPAASRPFALGSSSLSPKVPLAASTTRSTMTTYANVVNAASTREEVILLFGTNQSWKGLEEEVNVALSNRIILNPYAAKRLAIVLGAVVTQYESRFGPLGVTKDAQDKKEK